LYAATVEEEPDRGGSLALSLAKGVHQFLQCCGALDLKEDLIVVVGDLNVEMFTWATRLSLLGGTRASVVVRSRHLVQKKGDVDWNTRCWREQGYLSRVLVRVCACEAGEWLDLRDCVRVIQRLLELQRTLVLEFGGCGAGGS